MNIKVKYNLAPNNVAIQNLNNWHGRWWCVLLKIQEYFPLLYLLPIFAKTYLWSSFLGTHICLISLRVHSQTFLCPLLTISDYVHITSLLAYWKIFRYNNLILVHYSGISYIKDLHPLYRNPLYRNIYTYVGVIPCKTLARLQQGNPC